MAARISPLGAFRSPEWAARIGSALGAVRSTPPGSVPPRRGSALGSHRRQRGHFICAAYPSHQRTELLSSRLILSASVGKTLRSTAPTRRRAELGESAPTHRAERVHNGAPTAAEQSQAKSVPGLTRRRAGTRGTSDAAFTVRQGHQLVVVTSTVTRCLAGDTTSRPDATRLGAGAALGLSEES